MELRNWRCGKIIFLFYNYQYIAIYRKKLRQLSSNFPQEKFDIQTCKLSKCSFFFAEKKIGIIVIRRKSRFSYHPRLKLIFEASRYIQDSRSHEVKVAKCVKLRLLRYLRIRLAIKNSG